MAQKMAEQERGVSTNKNNNKKKTKQTEMGKHLLLVSLYHKLIRTIQSLKK